MPGRIALVYEIPDEPRAAHAATIRGLRAAAGAADVAVDAVALLRRGTLPKTTSGKVRRGDCRDRFVAGELDVVARWTRDL